MLSYQKARNEFDEYERKKRGEINIMSMLAYTKQLVLRNKINDSNKKLMKR